MPVPATNAPYDSLQLILHASRVRLNDAIASIGGEVLTDTAVFTQQACNSAWRRLQDMLANLGMARFKKEVILYSLPVIEAISPATVADPGNSVWMNWDQFFDGYNYFTSPVLPPDLISPLVVRERVTASAGGTPANFFKMDQLLNGLPAVPKVYRNWTWSWHNDSLYMPGTTVPTDIWVWYEAYLPDFATIGSVQWYDATIPMSRCLDPLSCLICSEVAKARGDLDAASFDAQAQAGCMAMMGREALQARSVDKPSELKKMTDMFTPTSAPAPLLKGQQ